MPDQMISQDPEVTSLQNGDYVPLIRAGDNKRISGLNLTSSVSGAGVSTFNGRSGAVSLISTDLNGLSGAGLTGIGSGTGGIINTGSTTIGADSDSDGIGVIALQTRGITRLQVNNDGTAQLIKNDLLIGTFNGGNAGGRLRLATDSPAIYAAFSEQTFDFTNGPVGETNYSNHTWGVFYNSDFNGTKVVAGEVNFGLAHEPKFSQGGAPFQTEIYYSWTDPSNAFSIRPWGMVIAHATGSTTFTSQGHIHFFRDIGQGGGQSAEWNEEGWLRFYTANAGVTFPNNIGGLKWRNAADDNTVVPLYVDNANKVQIGFGSDIEINGSMRVGSLTNVSTLTGDSDPDTKMQFNGGDIISWFSGNVQIMSIQPFGPMLELNALLCFNADNTYDVGFRNFTNFRPRNVYVGTDVITGGTLNVTTGGSTSISSGVGTVKMSSANPADNAAWIPLKYQGGTYYVPGWAAHNP